MKNLLNTAMRERPHLTEESIKFLEKFFMEHPFCNVLETGTGGTTVWFSRENRAGSLTSLEHSKEWYNKVMLFLAENKTTLTPGLNLNIRYIPEPYDSFFDSLKENSFDLILIDGYKDRRKCFVKALRVIKSGGVLMLDDAEVPLYKDLPNTVREWSITKTIQKREVRGSNAPYKHTYWWIKP